MPAALTNMDASDKLNRSATIYFTAWLYALIILAIGQSASDAVYSLLSTMLHTMLGYLVFTPMSGMLATVQYAAFFVLLIVCLPIISKLSKIEPIVRANRILFAFLKIYILIIGFISTCLLLVIAARVAPTFLAASLVMIGVNLWFSRSSIEKIERKKAKMSKLLFKVTVLNLIMLGLAVRIGEPWIFFLLIFMPLTVGNIISSFGARKRGIWGCAAAPRPMAFLVLCAGLGATGNFWVGTSAKCDRQQLAAGGARLLTATTARPYDVIMRPGTSKMYIVYKEGIITEFDLASGRITGALQPGGRGSPQRLIHNDRKNEIYATWWRGENDSAALVIALDPMRLEKILTVHKCPAIELELDHKTNSLLVLCEAGDKLAWFDYNTWKLTGALNFPRLTIPHTVRLDPIRRRIYVNGNSLSHYLYEIDADTRKVTRTAQIGYVSLGMVLDPPAHRAYLAKPLASKILVLDTETMQTIGEIPSRPGVRDLDIDLTRRRLHAGTYITGTFQTFDLDTWKPVKEIFVGKQVRGIYHDKPTNRDFAATTCGIMEVK